MKKTSIILTTIIIIILIAYFPNSEKIEIEEIIDKENIEEIISIEPEIEGFAERKESRIETPIILEEKREEEIIEENEVYHFSFSNYSISNEDQEIIDNNLDGLDLKGSVINFTGVLLDGGAFELFKRIEDGNIIMGNTIDIFGNVIDFESCKPISNGKKLSTSEGANINGQKNNNTINGVLCNSENYTFEIEIRINYLTFDGDVVGEKNFHIDTLLVEKELDDINKGTKNLSANTNGMFEKNNNHGYLINEN